MRKQAETFVPLLAIVDASSLHITQSNAGQGVSEFQRVLPGYGNPEVAGRLVTSTEVLDPGAVSFLAVVAPDRDRIEEPP